MRPSGVRNEHGYLDPALSGNYVQGTVSLHDGPISLADEQAQWWAWQQKLATSYMTVGP
jgi:hypothetical protein